MSLFGDGFLGSVIAGAGMAVPGVGPALTGLGLASDFLGSKSLQNDAQSFQRQFAQNQMQWRMADLRAAGLNPILAAGSQGASAPGTGIAGPRNTGSMVSSAVQARRVKSEIDLLKEQYQTQKVQQDTLATQSLKNFNDSLVSEATRRYWLQQTENLQLEYLRNSAQYTRDSILQDFWRTPLGKEMVILDQIAGQGAVGGIAKTAVSALKKPANITKTFNTFRQKLR